MPPQTAGGGWGWRRPRTIKDHRLQGRGSRLPGNLAGSTNLSLSDGVRGDDLSRSVSARLKQRKVLAVEQILYARSNCVSSETKLRTA